MLDLRLPSGVFFALLGLILISLGVISPEIRAPLSGFNVNLYAGLGMLLFGGLLLLLAQRRS